MASFPPPPGNVCLPRWGKTCLKQCSCVMLLFVSDVFVLAVRVCFVAVCLCFVGCEAFVVRLASVGIVAVDGLYRSLLPMLFSRNRSFWCSVDAVINARRADYFIHVICSVIPPEALKDTFFGVCWFFLLFWCCCRFWIFCFFLGLVCAGNYCLALFLACKVRGLLPDRRLLN